MVSFSSTVFCTSSHHALSQRCQVLEPRLSDHSLMQRVPAEDWSTTTPSITSTQRSCRQASLEMLKKDGALEPQIQLLKQESSPKLHSVQYKYQVRYDPIHRSSG